MIYSGAILQPPLVPYTNHPIGLFCRKNYQAGNLVYIADSLLVFMIDEIHPIQEQ